MRLFDKLHLVPEISYLELYIKIMLFLSTFQVAGISMPTFDDYDERNFFLHYIWTFLNDK